MPDISGQVQEGEGRRRGVSPAAFFKVPLRRVKTLDEEKITGIVGNFQRKVYFYAANEKKNWVTE